MMRRQYLIFIVALVAFVGSLTTVFATQDARDYYLRGYVDPSQTSDLPYRIPRLGVNADLFQYSPDELEQHLDWMQQANIRWVRQFIDWELFEPEAGQFQWQQLDTVMMALSSYPDMQLIPVFMNSPLWARISDVPSAPPDDPTAIVPFLNTFASRYGDEIDYYQIWDEPNLDDAWGLQDPRPAEYVALLAESYLAIHGHDANATVIAAALAPTTELSGQNIADVRYLEMMYQLGASEFFDAAAAKPYGFSLPPTDRTTNIETLNFSRIVLLREVMVANNDAQSALWASNWGWNSLPDSWSGDTSIWGQVDLDTRSHYTIEALSRAEREWAWLGGMILHHWQPNVADDNPQWGFAIISQSDEPTALWDALVNYPAQSAATNGLYHPRTEFAQYSGLWTFSERGADIGWLETSDSQFEFQFYGTDVSLLLREGNYFAFLYPTIDGASPNAIPHDANGNGYILLRSGSTEYETNIVPVARQLPLDEHTLHVVADRGWDQWALAGIAVSSGDLSLPYQRQLQMAWLAVFVSGLAIIVTAYSLPWASIYRRFATLTSGLDDAQQFAISVATSIALMLGMLMTWGMSEPQLFRRDLVEHGLLIIVTGGLLVIELPVIAVIVALCVMLWLIYHRLELGLFLTLLYTPFFLFPVELYHYAFPMSELLVLITTAAWILRLLVQWGIERQTATHDFPIQITRRLHSLDLMLLIWGILGCVAMIWSARLSPALTELRTIFVEPLLFYAIFRTIKLDWSQVKRLFGALLLAGFIVAIYGLFMYFTGQGYIEAGDGIRRLDSVYGSPNNVGLFLGRVIPYALVIVLLSRRWERYIALVILVALLVAVAYTQSIGALLIGVPVGVVTVIFVTYGKRSLPILGVLLVIGLIVTIGLMQVSTRFANLLELSSGTNFIRIRVWESSLELISNHPVTGLGLDQFLYAFRGHYIRPDAIADPDLSHPHNIILDFWIRLGVFGVVWLIAFMWLFWQRAIRLLGRIYDTQKRMVLLGVVGAMTATIAHGMIDNSIFIHDLVYVFVFTIGVMVQASGEIRGIVAE